MSWTYEQKFNTLNDGDLNGQDSWGGSASFDVETSVKYEGAKAVSFNSGTAGGISRTVAVTSGVFYIAMRKTANNAVDCFFDLWDSSGDEKAEIRLASDGNIKVIGNSSNTVGTYNINQWYVFGVELDAANEQFRVKINDGTGWGSWNGWYTVRNSPVDVFQTLEFFSTGNAGVTTYWDTITPTDPFINAYTQSILDSISLVTGTVGIRFLTRQTIANVVSLIDSGVSTTNIFYHAIVDRIILNEILVAKRIFCKTISEVISLVDNLSSKIGFRETLGGVISIVDISSIKTIYHKTITDALSLAESISSKVIYRMSMVASVLLADTIRIGGTWWTFLSKHISTWTQQAKNSSAWTQITKNVSSWSWKDKSDT
jgi:hypothetical protein